MRFLSCVVLKRQAYFPGVYFPIIIIRKVPKELQTVTDHILYIYIYIHTQAAMATYLYIVLYINNIIYIYICMYVCMYVCIAAPPVDKEQRSICKWLVSDMFLWLPMGSSKESNILPSTGDGRCKRGAVGPTGRAYR